MEQKRKRQRRGGQRSRKEIGERVGEVREEGAFRGRGLCPGSDAAQVSTEHRPLGLAPWVLTVVLTRAGSGE